MYHSTLTCRSSCCSESFASEGGISLITPGDFPLVLGDSLTCLCNQHSPGFLRVTIFGFIEMSSCANSAFLLLSLVTFSHFAHPRLSCVSSHLELCWAPFCAIAGKLSQNIRAHLVCFTPLC